MMTEWPFVKEEQDEIEDEENQLENAIAISALPDDEYERELAMQSTVDTAEEEGEEFEGNPYVCHRCKADIDAEFMRTNTDPRGTLAEALIAYSQHLGSCLNLHNSGFDRSVVSLAFAALAREKCALGDLLSRIGKPVVAYGLLPALDTGGGPYQVLTSDDEIDVRCDYGDADIVASYGDVVSAFDYSKDGSPLSRPGNT
jgi:hypothetical protein